MTMLIHKWLKAATTAGGIWQDNTDKLSGAQCMQVYASSATSDTVFDVIITDPNSVPIRRFLNVTGVLNDVTPFLMGGIHTVRIENATRDEAFTVFMCFWER